jgi:hypothetical protein
MKRIQKYFIRRWLMMKGLLKVNDNDNMLMTFVKGSVKGMIAGGVTIGVTSVIGAVMKNKTGENSEIEAEVLDTVEDVVE